MTTPHPSDAPTSPLPDQVVVVINAGSRRGAAWAPEAERRLRAETGAGRLHVVRSGSELSETLRQVVAEQPALLVVGGGDGSLSCAAGHLAGTATALGVLPLGTANDFARTLEIPVDLSAAWDAALHGALVDVDLGRVDGRPFVNVASLGLSVAVTERLTPRLKRHLGPVAYPVATLSAYRHHRPFSARLEFPAGDHETRDLHDLMQVAVGNGRYYGGGNLVAPLASVDDHLLDVYAIERGRLRDHISIARFLRDGTFVEHERVHHLTTRSVRVVTERPLPVNLDGEVAASTPATFSVERDAVLVKVPHGGRAARLGR